MKQEKSKNSLKNKSFFNMKIIMIMMLTLLISGCNSQGRDNLPDANYHSGTEGLHLEFLPNAPPSKIYNKDPLDVMLEVTNRGATDVVQGKIYLTGFDKNYLQLTSTDSSGGSISIEGKSIYNPDGRLNKIIGFTDGLVEVPEGADKIAHSIKATACYLYQTQGQGSVCIDPDPRKITEKVCTVSTVSMGGSQGAPIAITSIEPQITRDRATFKINFQNVGGGTVFDNHIGVNNCHTSLEYTDIDVVDVIVKLSDKTLTCEPNNGMGVRLLNGNGYLYCYYAGNLGEDAYSTQISVEINYGYRTSISKNIEVVNI